MVWFVMCCKSCTINALGVDNKKFDGGKATADGVAAIAQTKDLDDPADAETIFEENRDAIQYQFRSVCV